MYNVFTCVLGGMCTWSIYDKNVCDVHGELISSGVSARHCCLELSAGRAYDFGGNQELCHTCEGQC